MGIVLLILHSFSNLFGFYSGDVYIFLNACVIAIYFIHIYNNFRVLFTIVATHSVGYIIMLRTVFLSSETMVGGYIENVLCT